MKKEKDKLHKLSVYEYFRWSVADGWAVLDRFASQYLTLEPWEAGKQLLKTCLLQALQLTYLLAAPLSKAILKPSRKINASPFKILQ